MPMPPGPPAQSKPSAPPFANQPGAARIRLEVGAVRAADEVRVRAHRADDARAAGEGLEPREGVRHALEREREREDAAAVDAGGELLGVDLGRLGVRREASLLHGVSREAVALGRPSRARGRARACPRACPSSC